MNPYSKVILDKLFSSVPGSRGIYYGLIASGGIFILLGLLYGIIEI